MYVHSLGRSEELQAHRLPLRAPRPVSRTAAPSSHRSELRVTNAWPSVIEARPNRNAIGEWQEQQRGDYRRAALLGGNTSEPRQSTRGESKKKTGGPVRAWEIKAGCTRSALRKFSAQEPAQGPIEDPAADVGVAAAPKTAS